MKTITVNYSNTNITVIPDSRHDFIMSTKEVAVGFGCHPDTIRSHKSKYKHELEEGKHYLSNVQILHAAHPGSARATFWTKRGIIRLGFFIKSERAKAFRDWAEDFIIDAHLKKQAKQATLFTEATTAPKPLNPSGRNINRLTPARLIAIMQDVIRIEDATLRQSISEKLLNPTK